MRLKTRIAFSQILSEFKCDASLYFPSLCSFIVDSDDVVNNYLGSVLLPLAKKKSGMKLPKKNQQTLQKVKWKELFAHKPKQHLVRDLIESAKDDLIEWKYVHYIYELVVNCAIELEISFSFFKSRIRCKSLPIGLKSGLFLEST